MKLAYVGLPCQLQALRKVDYFSDQLGQEWTEEVELTVGLFCRENWAYTCFRAMVEDDFGVALNEVEKFDIKKNKIIGKADGETFLKIPLPESKPFVRVGCQVCLDFSGELCDLSVGAVGTPADTSTVIIRTEKARRLLEKAEEAGYVEVRSIEDVKPGLWLVNKLTEEKRDENLEEAQVRERAGYPARHIPTLGLKDTRGLVEEARGKKFADLEREVIDSGSCMACGTCVALSQGKLEMEEERPQLKGMDSEELWKCYFACPRTSFPSLAITEDFFQGEERLTKDSLGQYKEVLAVKATEKANLKKWQDGGAVTALLAYAMEEGMVEEVVSAKHEEWKPEPAISSSLKELYDSAGTIYSYVTNMPQLKKEAEK